MTGIDINWNPDRRELRLFAGGLAFLFTVVGIFCIAGEVTKQVTGIWFGLALVNLMLALMYPQAAKPVYLLWMVLIHPFRWVISGLLIGVVYYLVITPIGILMRLAGSDPIDRHNDPGATTYWKPKQRARKPADYFRQF